jgi:hypothetical protein
MVEEELRQLEGSRESSMKKTQLRMDEVSKVGEELREAPRLSQPLTVRAP